MCESMLAVLDTSLETKEARSSTCFQYCPSSVAVVPLHCIVPCAPPPPVDRVPGGARLQQRLDRLRGARRRRRHQRGLPRGVVLRTAGLQA